MVSQSSSFPAVAAASGFLTPSASRVIKSKTISAAAIAEISAACQFGSHKVQRTVRVVCWRKLDNIKADNVQSNKGVQNVAQLTAGPSWRSAPAELALTSRLGCSSFLSAASRSDSRTCRYISWVHDVDIKTDHNRITANARFDLVRDPFDSEFIVVKCVDQVKAGRDVVVEILWSLLVSMASQLKVRTAMRVRIPAWIDEFGLIKPCS